MTKKSTKRENDQKAKDLVEAWNLLKCGRDILLANLDLGWESPDNREANKLNRVYILAKRDFNTILRKYPEIEEANGLFNSIVSLTAFDNDYMLQWHKGNPIDPTIEYGISDFYGGLDYCRSELSHIEEEAILAGAESLEMPENANYRGTYDAAISVLEDADAAKKLLNGEIGEYSLTWDNMSGRVMVNDVYEVAKTQVDSNSIPNNLMRIIHKHQEEGKRQFTFDFEPIGKKRKTSQIINEDLHITPLMRTIFFPGSWGKKVCFRSPVSREEVLKSNPDINELYKFDLALVKAGAKIK